LTASRLRNLSKGLKGPKQVRVSGAGAGGESAGPSGERRARREPADAAAAGGAGRRARKRARPNYAEPALEDEGEEEEEALGSGLGLEAASDYEEELCEAGADALEEDDERYDDECASEELARPPRPSGSCRVQARRCRGGVRSRPGVARARLVSLRMRDVEPLVQCRR